MTKKIFIVGTPRSGTTLLQGMLAGHPRVFSLPETFFFAKVSGKSWLKRYLLWPAIKVRSHLRWLVREMGREDLLPIAEIGLFQRDYARPFVELMDRMSMDDGKDVWVEKTPWHLYCIDLIVKEIPDALFVHIVRGGEDTVASLYKASNNNPDGWAFLRSRFKPKFTGFSVRECVERWNRDVSISMGYKGVANHHIVRYEEIVSNPEKVMRGLCDFVGITYDVNMIRPQQAFAGIVRSDEAWKSNNAGEIKLYGNNFLTVFSEREQAWIKGHLKDIDLEIECDI